MSGYGARFEDWFSGSYYELAIELALESSDSRLSAAVDALWTAPRMQGPWSDKSYTHTAATVLPESDSAMAYYGALAVDEIGEVPCVSWIIRESGGGADWLNLGVPTRALVEHGLDRVLCDAPEFTASFDRAFAEIGTRIFTRAGFELGIIGEETSGKYSSRSFSETDLAFTGFLVPEPLWNRIGVASGSEIYAPGLKWIPPTGTS